MKKSLATLRKIALDVCCDYGIEAPCIRIRKMARYAGLYSHRRRLITLDPDATGGIATFLHELAHCILESIGEPRSESGRRITHGVEFWRICGDLLLDYGGQYLLRLEIETTGYVRGAKLLSKRVSS